MCGSGQKTGMTDAITVRVPATIPEVRQRGLSAFFEAAAGFMTNAGHVLRTVIFLHQTSAAAILASDSSRQNRDYPLFPPEQKRTFRDQAIADIITLKFQGATHD